MKKLLTLFTLLFSIVAYGAVPLGTVPYAQLDTNDFGVTVAGHINTRLGVHTPSTPGDTWYLTINGTNINNGGTNFLQSINPTAGFLPVRGANTNFVDSLILQDATGLHVGTNFAGIIDYFGYPALTLGDTGGVNTYLTLYPDGLFLKDHYGNALNLYGQTANIGGLIYGKSIMQLGTMWGKVELADDNPAHTAKFQPTLPMGTSHTTLGSSTNAWEGLYAGSTKMFQFFDVVIDPGVSTNLNFAVDGVTYNIGAGGGSVGGTTINSLDNYLPMRLNAGAFDNSPLYVVGSDIALDSGFIWGPGVTNVMFRSGSSLVISNMPSLLIGDATSLVTLQNQASKGVLTHGTAFELGANASRIHYDGSGHFYPIDPGNSSLGFGTNYWKNLVLGTNQTGVIYWDNGVSLMRNNDPVGGAGSVTYSIVTNALLATGSSSDIFHGDGSWSPGGSGGETNWFLNGSTLEANALASIMVVGDKNHNTNYVQLETFQDTFGNSRVIVFDGVDSLTLQADNTGDTGGSTLFINTVDVLPFQRVGTDITTRTAGDTVTLTGMLTVTSDLLVGDSATITNYVGMFVTPGAASGVVVWDGLDEVSVVSDYNHNSTGSGVFLNGSLVTPFSRDDATGEITTITPGDFLTITGTGTNTTDTGWSMPILIVTNNVYVTDALLPGLTTIVTNMVPGIITNRMSFVSGILLTNEAIAW